MALSLAGGGGGRASSVDCFLGGGGKTSSAFFLGGGGGVIQLVLVFKAFLGLDSPTSRKVQSPRPPAPAPDSQERSR